jgi:CRISPR-associated endonuclease/helicase Cas3
VTSLAAEKVSLRAHLQTATAVATHLTHLLDFPSELADAVIKACEWHDAGKKRPWWQAAIGNPDAEPLAKSDEPAFDRELNGGYRHEFGSLLEATDDPSLAQHPHRDLILHLIAAHHGWARPTFEPSAYDRTRLTPVCDQAAREAALRFVRLQRAYGWWQLAYLEAVVKCADAIASANPQWSGP